MLKFSTQNLNFRFEIKKFWFQYGKLRIQANWINIEP